MMTAGRIVCSPDRSDSIDTHQPLVNGLLRTQKVSAIFRKFALLSTVIFIGFLSLYCSSGAQVVSSRCFSIAMKTFAVAGAVAAVVAMIFGFLSIGSDFSQQSSPVCTMQQLLFAGGFFEEAMRARREERFPGWSTEETLENLVYQFNSIASPEWNKFWRDKACLEILEGIHLFNREGCFKIKCVNSYPGDGRWREFIKTIPQGEGAMLAFEGKTLAMRHVEENGWEFYDGTKIVQCFSRQTVQQFLSHWAKGAVHQVSNGLEISILKVY